MSIEIPTPKVTPEIKVINSLSEVVLEFFIKRLIISDEAIKSTETRISFPFLIFFKYYG